MSFPRASTVALLAMASLAIAFVVACGSSSKGGETPPLDGAVADSGADTSSLEDGGAAPGQGYVNFSEVAEGGGSIAAGFSFNTATATVCTTADAGACTSTSCPKPMATDAGAGAMDAGMPPNAGTLTVSGGIFGAAGIGVGTDKVGDYLYPFTTPIFAPGDTLGVSAAGDTVPAFSKQTVVAPPTIKLTAPAAAAGKITIPTSTDLQVSWTGGLAGAKVYFIGSALFTTGGGANVVCSWDGGGGSGTVPKAALTPLAASNALANGSSVTYFQAARTEFSAGTWPVTVSAYTTQASLAAFQ